MSSSTSRNGVTALLSVLFVALSTIGASPAVAGDADRGPVVHRQQAPQASFPTASSAGVPNNWQPKRTINGDHTISRKGAVVQDLRINGNLVIAAPDVTVKRVDVVGGSINNYGGSSCQTGLRLKRTTVRRGPGQTTSGDEPAIQAGGYVASRVYIDGLPEGFRVGGKDDCGPVKIKRSYARVTSPDDCGDWHGDALQGFDGARLTIRDSRLDLDETSGCGGTAPFFYPAGQGNTSVDIDGLIVNGGGYSFRLGTAGTVRNLNIVKGGYGYGPIDVKCSALDEWEADIVRLDTKGQPVTLRGQRCNTEEGE